MPCDPAVSQHFSEQILLNIKSKYDNIEQLNLQALADNQENARTWNKITQNNAIDSQLLKFLATDSMVIAGDTADTENEQNTSPADQGMAEVEKGSVGVAADTTATANAAVAASIGNLATAIVPIIAGATGVVTAQTLAAVLSAVVTAAGNAAASQNPTNAGNAASNPTTKS